MKILITGGAGYIGSILCDTLLKRGYEIICLDKLYFGNIGIKNLINEKNFKLVKEDTRSFDSSILKGIDIVIDLAAISQPDPENKLKSELFYEMNYKGPVRVANLSKKYGVRKYFFASTCSVYGFQSKLVNENSSLNPLEEYAKTKIMAEKEIKSLSSKNFCVTIFRFATVYGLSPKMRFDLVVNGMTLALWKFNKIKIMRPGTQMRPVVHIRDTVKALILAMECEQEIINGQIFNVGSNDQNYSIYELAKRIGDSSERSYTLEWYGEPDKRTYSVDFQKINKILNFKVDYYPEDAVKEIFKALDYNIIEDAPHTRVIEWWEYLQSSEQV